MIFKEPKPSTPTHGTFWSGGCGSTCLLQGDVWQGEITLAEFINRTGTFWCPAAIPEHMEAFGASPGVAAEVGHRLCTAKPRALNCTAGAKFCEQPLSESRASLWKGTDLGREA